MIKRLKIGDYMFMTDEGSTFIEYLNLVTDEGGHFNVDRDWDFKKACIMYYNNRLI